MQGSRGGSSADLKGPRADLIADPERPEAGPGADPGGRGGTGSDPWSGPRADLRADPGVGPGGQWDRSRSMRWGVGPKLFSC